MEGIENFNAESDCESDNFHHISISSYSTVTDFHSCFAQNFDIHLILLSVFCMPELQFFFSRSHSDLYVPVE